MRFLKLFVRIISIFTKLEQVEVSEYIVVGGWYDDIIGLYGYGFV